MLRDLVSASWRRAVAAAAASVSAFAIVLPAGPGVRPIPAHPGPAMVRAVQVSPPADSHQPQGTGLYTVICTGRGECLAGGNYEDSSGTVQPMVASQVQGTWVASTRLTLPANAARQPYAQVNGIACRAAGDCVAVGNYTYGHSYDGAFIAVQANGGWGEAFTPALPADAASPRRARLDAVTCRPDGFCEAVGSYLDSADQIQLMAVAKPAGGPWGRATKITAPAGAAASPDAVLTSVSCIGPGSCVAVGHYNDGPTATRGLGAVETAGRWSRAAGIPAPRGSVASGFTGLSSVSCRPAGRCLAVGVYAVNSSQDRAMSVTESGGTFGTAVPVTAVPDGAAVNPSTAMSGVSCPPTGPCVAAGVATNAAGHYVATYATRAHGHWQVVFLTGPGNVSTGKDEQSSLFSVSCPTSDYCTSVGYYNDASGGYSAGGASTWLRPARPGPRPAGGRSAGGHVSERP